MFCLTAMAALSSAPAVAQETGGEPPPQAEPEAPGEETPELLDEGEPEFDLDGAGDRRELWFFLGLYGWVSAIDGDVYDRGRRIGIDISMEEVLESVDRALFFYSEVHYGRFFAAFDGSFVDLNDDESSTLTDVEIDIEQEIYELRFGYELIRRDLGGESEEGSDWTRELIVDVFAGTRYTSLEIDIDTTVLDAGTIRFDEREDRWDPIIGARIKADLSRRWFVMAGGDVGGFGIGAAAEFTWQAQGAVGFRVSPKAAFLAGYRAIGTDTVSGSPRDGLDWVQHGVFFGFGLRF